jgi:hypothetical protein
MIYGFNTDVLGNGVTYHVQTEDRGAKSPVIDTLIYSGGKIVERMSTPYNVQIISQGEIEELVRNQHRSIVESIRNGKFSDRRIEAEADSIPSGYEITLLNSDSLVREGQFHFTFRVWNRLESQTAKRTLLELKLLPSGQDEQHQSTWTDENGVVTVQFPLPTECSEAALLACASGSAGREVVKYLVRGNITV